MAHAYDKVPDSLRTVQALRQLYRELRHLSDSVRRRRGFIVELGLISTQVHNHALADAAHPPGLGAQRPPSPTTRILYTAVRKSTRMGAPPFYSCKHC